MGDTNEMELSAYELARLRVEDGHGQAGDEALLNNQEQSADRRLKRQIGWALTAVEAPSIADVVMNRVGRFPLPVGSSIEGEAHSPELSSSVMSELGLGEGIGSLVQEAVIHEAGPAPALWGDLCASVGGSPLGGASGILRQAIHQESGAGFGPTKAFQAGRSWWPLGMAAGAVLAAAAAVLLYMGFATESGPSVEASMGPEEMEIGE